MDSLRFFCIRPNQLLTINFTKADCVRISFQASVGISLCKKGTCCPTGGVGIALFLNRRGSGQPCQKSLLAGANDLWDSRALDTVFIQRSEGVLPELNSSGTLPFSTKAGNNNQPELRNRMQSCAQCQHFRHRGYGPARSPLSSLPDYNSRRSTERASRRGYRRCGRYSRRRVRQG